MPDILLGLLLFLLGLCGALFAHRFNSQHDKFWARATSKSEEEMKQFRSTTPITRVVSGIAAVGGLVFMLKSLAG